MNARCFSILFADKVFREDNGKHGVIGIFSAFNFPSMPAGVPVWFVYVAMGDVEPGKHEFTVNLVRDSATEVVWASSGELTIDERGFGDIEIVLPVVGCAFKKCRKSYSYREPGRLSGGLADHQGRRDSGRERISAAG